MKRLILIIALVLSGCGSDDYFDDCECGMFVVVEKPFDYAYLFEEYCTFVENGYNNEYDLMPIGLTTNDLTFGKCYTEEYLLNYINW